MQARDRYLHCVTMEHDFLDHMLLKTSPSYYDVNIFCDGWVMVAGVLDHLACCTVL